MSPSLLEHCDLTFSRYGVYGDDIHIWIDEPVALYGPHHRRVRHDPNQQIPIEFINKYGLELARNIILDHILEDSKTPFGIRDYKVIDEQKIKKVDEAEFQEFMKYLEEKVKNSPPIPKPKGFDKFLEYMEEEVKKREKIEKEQFKKIEFSNESSRENIVSKHKDSPEYLRLLEELHEIEKRLNKIQKNEKDDFWIRLEKVEKQVEIAKTTISDLKGRGS